MTMVSDWLGPGDRDERETEDGRYEGLERESVDKTQATLPPVLAPLDPALNKLLERGDDRLLRDVGLSRESPFAEVAKFWAQWSRQRGPWGL